MADYLATYETPGTGAVMQVEVNFAGQRPDLPNDPAPYLDPANVKAMIVTEATSTTVEVVRDITITLVNSTTFRTDEIVPLGTILRVYRITDIEFPIVDFVSLQVVSEADLDLQARQTLYAVMESRDAATRAQVYANFAQSVSVEANASAKDAVEKAEAAVRTADAAALAATNAVQVANQANTKSDEALAAAEAAEEHATNVETLAQSAQDAAAAAQQEATDARLAAENAVNIANGIDGKADAALEAAQRADTNAAQALSVANGIAATAEAARVTANEAKDAADNAVSVAGAVDAKAQTALDTANAANVSAQNAVLIAQAAVTSATNANGGVTAANGRIDVLSSRVLALETWRTAATATLTNHDTNITLNYNSIEALKLRAAALEALNAPRLPEFVLECADNAAMVIVNGELWMSCGSAAVYTNIGVGRGASGLTGRYGLDNFQQVPIPSQSPVVQATTNGQNSFALLANGDLYAWGNNGHGQLGLGHTTAQGTPTLSAQGVREIYGHYTNAAYSTAPSKMYIRKDDAIYAAGYNAYGQLGVGDATNRSTWTATWVLAGAPVRKVFNLGADFGCGVILTTDNRMFVCGRNLQGQLGTGNGSDVRNWTDVTAAWGGTAAVAQMTDASGGFGYSSTAGDGTCWLAMFSKNVGVRVCGANTYGILGNGNTTNTVVPFNTPLPSLPVDWMVLGDQPGAIFILGQDKRIYSWGYCDSNGQLGRGLTTSNATPGALPLTNVAALLSRGQSQYGYGFVYAAFVLLESGVVMGWGANGYGTAGAGDTAVSLVPRRVLLPYREPDGSVMVPHALFYQNGSQAAGGPGTIGMFTKAGNLYAWGHNGQQQLSGQGAASASEVVPAVFTVPWRKRT